MLRDRDGQSSVWRCLRCTLTYVTDETVAAVAARPSDFRAMLADAAAAPASRDGLSCPRCRTPSLHELRVRSVTVDICSTCGSMVLDPGEEKVLARLASSPAIKLDAALSFADGANVAAQIAAMIVKSVL